MKRKNVYVIAGPNGAGKTTFASVFLPRYAKSYHFINADLIAQGLSPFAPEQSALKAGKLVLEQIREFSSKGLDFGFETTLSGQTYIRYLKRLKKQGYHIHLFFLWVPTPQLSNNRIQERVLNGGHFVPPEDVKRRFKRSISNFFNVYQALATRWFLFDNSKAYPELIARNIDKKFIVQNEALFKKIKNQKRER